MNTYQQKLFDELSELVASENDAFYKRDYVRDSRHYRVFAYRLASYTEFQKPSAVECRGTMFEITDPNQTPVIAKRLVALPMEKFWNLNENPNTMNLDLSKIVGVEVKADGSLISTYAHINSVSKFALGIKSKTSIESEQVAAVYSFLQKETNQAFAKELTELACINFTVNLEWCAPDNRVVIGYLEPQLTVLNIRDHNEGRYLEKNEPDLDYYPEVRNRWIESVNFDSPEQFIKNVPDMLDVEGFVLKFASGQRVKVKTTWYLALHHTKDSINSERRLYESVLAEAADDLRALFFNDPLILERIGKMEAFVEGKYNTLCKQVDEFYDTNKTLSRKDYAILGQKVLDRHGFKIAMERYIGRDISVKEYMASKWKEFGIKDEPTEERVVA